jgi:hypothetical protein
MCVSYDIYRVRILRIISREKGPVPVLFSFSVALTPFCYAGRRGYTLERP